MRKEYKELLERKKEERNERWMKVIEEDKSIKNFWKQISIKRKKRRDFEEDKERDAEKSF